MMIVVIMIMVMAIVMMVMVIVMITVMVIMIMMMMILVMITMVIYQLFINGFNFTNAEDFFVVCFATFFHFPPFLAKHQPSII